MPALLCDLDTLTPVVKAGSYWIKRDDLYQPFDVPLNGSKVRQCLYWLGKHRKHIKQHCNGVVATVSSVHSPQGYLVTRCAHHYGFRTVIGVGACDATTLTQRFPSFRLAVEMGAEVIKLSGVGYDQVLQSRLDELNHKNHWFGIKFGMGKESRAINEQQVNNLPPLDHLVIPCGSGLTASSILMGLYRVEKRRRPRNVHVVQIAGFDRRDAINAPLSYHFVKDTTYPYARRVPLNYHGIDLDDRYESKAFEWMEKQQLPGRVCFWVIGNFNILRGGEA
jgi:1-aminocyclopropane-1-carboxylate deaminase/D-cysteine desulfhydrase-like pyridoxal-dependent ACC family enzyme